jgi:hypothetical protein
MLFPLWATMIDTAVNNHTQSCMQMYIFISLGCVPRCGTAEPCGHTMLYVEDIPSCFILLSHQKFVRISLSPHPFQQLLLCISLNYNHLSGCEAAFHGGFDLYL